MPFIGNKPSAVPLTSADIADGIITSAKIVDATIANADIANSTINLTTKVTGTLPVANGGTGLAALGTSLQVLRTNTGATALEFATIGGTTTPFAVTGDATSGSEIRLPEDTDNGANYVALKAADSLAANLTLTLPSADGTSGQVLQTNGSGVLSFAGVSANAGEVIQVKTATDSTVRSTTSTTFVTGSNTLSVSITPSSASNKILVTVFTVGGIPSTHELVLTVYRGATNIGNGNNGLSGAIAGSGVMPMAFSVFDSPATTSATTYQVYFRSTSSAETQYINQRGVSIITVMEVKG